MFEGVYQSQIRDPSGPEVERISAAYSKRFKRPMTLPWYVATAYDSVNLIAHCARKVVPTPAAIRDCIAGTKDLAGISQTLSFNAGGSSPQIESMFQLRKGIFVHEPVLQK